MTSDLALHIQSTPLIDTHEHLNTEQEWVKNGPDVLGDLFAMYIGNDLISAGAPFENVRSLVFDYDQDVEKRWDGVKDAWEHCRYTGYGRAVRRMAKLIYNMDTINAQTVMAAARLNAQLRQPGQRLRLLKEVANLDHVQIDNFVWACNPDHSGLEFFLTDLSWVNFANGQIDPSALHDETGVDVFDLFSLKEAMAGLFVKYGATAVAVKSQHAYERTLNWQARTDSEASRILQHLLQGNPLNEAEKLCLGDWCLARGVELAGKYNLPFKIHTGYLAGNEFYTEPLRTHPSGLTPLIVQYPQTRFVLMHIAYPFSAELSAMAKHFPNIYVDMCWGWAINPYHAADFIRRFLHSVPVNKLFIFGGDSCWPTSVVAYAAQAREWLTYALQSEIDDGFLTEAEAITIATRLMAKNQFDCFNITATRAAIKTQLATEY